MSTVFLAENPDVLSYPTADDYYSPKQKHPEYPWPDTTLSEKENGVYDLVRECFRLTGYDDENYGSRNWNPLGHVIAPGNTVLVKPNWVENKNTNHSGRQGLECLVTHPSVIRAVLDYTVIALKGTGRIIVADAPMQGCDLEDLLEKGGYNKLFSFYRSAGITIETADLRKYSVDTKYDGVFEVKKGQGTDFGSVKVSLDQRSMHASKDQYDLQYKVSDYLLTDTEKYHHQGKHIYEINKIALEADVVINMPKPKTHRLAGMTAACKNLVGITYEKASLPHRVPGNQKGHGDAYRKASFWKRSMERFDEKRTISSNKRQFARSKINDLLMKACFLIGSMITGDSTRIGSWYGNDTIWRTVVDLNFILNYADKNGIICKESQRKIITIADLIIAGQGSGPVGPDPKQLGMIMMSDNSFLFDRICCELMGFDHRKLPMLHSRKAARRSGYSSREVIENEKIITNRYGEQTTASFKGKAEWEFEPHPGWKGHIEKRKGRI